MPPPVPENAERHRDSTRSPGARGAASLLLLLLLAATAGCESIGRDLSDFAEDLVPPTPTQAVLWSADRDPDLRRKGTLLLANAPFGGNPPYLARYRDSAVHETNPLVLAVTIRALGKHGEPEDADLVVPHLQHPNLQVRWESAKALARLHWPPSAGALVTVVLTPEERPEVRAAAADALGQYPQDAVFQALVAALDDRSLAVNLAAERSLGTITGRALGLEPRAWLVWYRTSAKDPFALRRDYLFPTYYRSPSFLESLAFWKSPIVELPAPPAGLRSVEARRTYADDPAEDG